MNLSANVVLADRQDGMVTFKSSSGNTKTTANSRTCSFWNAMRLPCRHIFSTRHMPLGIRLYDTALFL